MNYLTLFFLFISLFFVITTSQISTGAPPPEVSSTAPIPIISSTAPIPVISSTAPIPIISSTAPIPVISSTAPPPEVSSTAPIPIISSTAPIPVISSTAPPPEVSSTAPPPEVSSTAPIPIISSTAPIPVISSTAPIPIISSTAPIPVISSTAPIPIISSTAPIPVISSTAPPPIVSSTAPPPIVSSSAPPFVPPAHAIGYYFDFQEIFQDHDSWEEWNGVFADDLAEVVHVNKDQIRIINYGPSINNHVQMYLVPPVNDGDQDLHYAYQTWTDSIKDWSHSPFATKHYLSEIDPVTVSISEVTFTFCPNHVYEKECPVNPPSKNNYWIYIIIGVGVVLVIGISICIWQRRSRISYLQQQPLLGTYENLATSESSL